MRRPQSFSQEGCGSLKAPSLNEQHRQSSPHRTPVTTLSPERLPQPPANPSRWLFFASMPSLRSAHSKEEDSLDAKFRLLRGKEPILTTDILLGPDSDEEQENPMFDDLEL